MGRVVVPLALTLLVLLPAATFYFFEALQGFAVAERQKVALGRHLRMLEASEADYRRYLRFVERATAFIERARRAGAEAGAWDRYHVSLQETVTFDQLSSLLDQAERGPAYYFSPARLDVRLGQTGGEEGGEDAPGDARLTLQGTFLVRRR